MRSEVDGSARRLAGPLPGHFRSAGDYLSPDRCMPISDERFQSAVIVELMRTAIRKLGGSNHFELHRRARPV